MLRSLSAALLAATLAGCVAQPSPVPPASSPTPPPTVPPSIPPPIPPPATRAVPTVTLHGSVKESAGNRPAAHALVTARLTSAGCAVPGERSSVFADEHGNYSLTLEGAPGPDFATCVLLAATLGGATGRRELREISFLTPLNGALPQRVHADLTLGSVEPLTIGEGHALVDAFVAMVNRESGDDARMSTHVVGGPEALRTAVEDYQSILGGNVTATIESNELTGRGQRVTAMLHGSKGTSLSLLVIQDSSRRLHSPLLYYSLYSRQWAASFSRVVGAGDAAALARLLSADDIDVSVATAARVLAKYRPAFEVRGGSFELVAVDERRNTLTYRLTWQGESESRTSTIVLRYGDGLLGLVDEAL